MNDFKLLSILIATRMHLKAEITRQVYSKLSQLYMQSKKDVKTRDLPLF
jgi:hypothetical protein